MIGISPRRTTFIVFVSFVLLVHQHAGIATQARAGETQSSVASFDQMDTTSLWTMLDMEAADATAHAAFAVNHPDNLENIQRHTRHVRHLIEPNAEPNRPMPGREYGVAPTGRAMLARLGAGRLTIPSDLRAAAETELRQLLAVSARVLQNCREIIAAQQAEHAIGPARANHEIMRALRNGAGGAASQASLSRLKQILVLQER